MHNNNPSHHAAYRAAVGRRPSVVEAEAEAVDRKDLDELDLKMTTRSVNDEVWIDIREKRRTRAIVRLPRLLDGRLIISSVRHCESLGGRKKGRGPGINACC